MVHRSSCCSETGEKVWGYCMAMLLVLSCCHHLYDLDNDDEQLPSMSNMAVGRRCEEIYVVREGETLQTIGDKCGDPFIVEENPHIHDPDDVFPGLVIKINPSFHQPPRRRL